jgi:Zn-dependent M16 (insulinase) family peptidase
VARNLNEAWSGIHQLQTIKRLTDNISDDRLKRLAGDLVSIHKKVFRQNNLKIALIGEENIISAAESSTQSLCDQLREDNNGKKSEAAFNPPEIEILNETPREGWSTSTAVSFVAQTFATVRMEHEDSPALTVISKMLRSLYLHREIREKGGAYGGFSLYNPEDGLFCLASYRDPHIVSTLGAFKNAADFIRSDHYGEEDINEAILQVCSEIDKPDPPGPAARKAFYRKIISLTDEARQRFKQRLLSLNRDQVLAVARKYFDSNQENHAVAVISGEPQLNSANEKLERPLKLQQI